MIVWRISNHVSLDGGGGLRASSRWHTRGRRIVYFAPNPATALLEILVHAEVDLEDLPVRYRYLKIDVPDGTSKERLEADNLPRDWREAVDLSRQVGDEWLRSSRSATLEIPSVVVPETFNLLLNPTHAQANQLAIVQVIEHDLDARLL